MINTIHFLNITWFTLYLKESKRQFVMSCAIWRPSGYFKPSLSTHRPNVLFSQKLFLSFGVWMLHAVTVIPFIFMCYTTKGDMSHFQLFLLAQWNSLFLWITLMSNLGKIFCNKNKHVMAFICISKLTSNNTFLKT